MPPTLSCSLTLSNAIQLKGVNRLALPKISMLDLIPKEFIEYYDNLPISILITLEFSTEVVWRNKQAQFEKAKTLTAAPICIKGFNVHSCPVSRYHS